jgi:hypothetical protein
MGKKRFGCLPWYKKWWWVKQAHPDLKGIYVRICPWWISIFNKRTVRVPMVTNLGGGECRIDTKNTSSSLDR